MTKKLERPFYLNMPFDEAMLRYAATDPSEVQPPPKRAGAPRKRKAARPKPGGQSVEDKAPTNAPKPARRPKPT